MVSQFEENRRAVFSERLKSLVSGWETSHGEKLTQEKLGSAVCASREAVCGWLNGKTLPSFASVSALCEFFSVSPQYFDPEESDLVYTDEQRHRELSDRCQRAAEKVGLSRALLQFIKESPGLADLVVRASWVDPVINPPDSKVPANPDNSPFQFESSNGVRVYLPDDVLYMLRCVQRDLEEYAGFMIQKYSGVIAAHHNAAKKERDDPSRISPVDRFSLDLAGMPSLSLDESLLVDCFRRLDDKGKTELIKCAAHSFTRARKAKGGEPEE